MFGRLLILFIVVPLTDLFLLMWISKYTGVLFTIGLVILTGIIGASLAKQQGAMVRKEINARIARRESPFGLLSDGAMILFAAGLLLTPGLLTDILGFSLLIPASRKFYKSVIGSQFKNSVQFETFPGGQQSPRNHGPDIIDGHVVRPDSEDDDGIIEGEIVDRTG